MSSAKKRRTKKYQQAALTVRPEVRPSLVLPNETTLERDYEEWQAFSKRLRAMLRTAKFNKLRREDSLHLKSAYLRESFEARKERAVDPHEWEQIPTELVPEDYVCPFQPEQQITIQESSKTAWRLKGTRGVVLCDTCLPHNVLFFEYAGYDVLDELIAKSLGPSPGRSSGASKAK